MDEVRIQPLSGLGEIYNGDDLAELLAQEVAEKHPRPGDVLVVTQKVVSKAEGRMVDLRNVDVSSEAGSLAQQTGKDARLVQLVLDESTEVLRAVRGVLITRHRSGVVMANAGIDSSNVGPSGADRVLLLPLDCDLSAERIAASIEEVAGVSVGVVVSDSFGRPWRNGVVNVALGCARLPALYDKRGEIDRDGRTLQATLIAYGDLIASAAGLAMGEGSEGIPAALVRGLQLSGRASPASSLVRPIEEDLFR